MDFVPCLKVIFIFLFEEALVECVGPIVLKLRPVQVVLEVEAGGEPEADPERGVAGDLVARLPPPLHLDSFDDIFWPKFSQHFCRFFAGDLSSVLHSEQHSLRGDIRIVIRVIFLHDGCFNIELVATFVFVSKILISFVN